MSNDDLKLAETGSDNLAFVPVRKHWRDINAGVNPRCDCSLFDSDVMAWDRHGSAKADHLFRLVDPRQSVEPRVTQFATPANSSTSLEEMGVSIEIPTFDRWRNVPVKG